MNYKFTLLFLIILLASSGQLFSQKTIKIRKTDNPPVIDGNVDDKCWETAASFGDFLQREPNEGEPMTDSTRVYLCYDANNIYFGFICYQDPKTVSSKEMLRDAITGTDDRIALMLDTYLDHRTGYFFTVTALGAKEDATVNPNGMNRSWDGLWEGKTKITDKGWELEYAIPFKSIGFNKNSDKWGLFINRFIKRKNEWGSWPIANVNSSQFQIADGGVIEGLEGITQGIGLDISPYFITGFDSKRDTKTKYKINCGPDVFYHITPSLKASLSINTDFAETEADARQINLTRFSIRLSEKRNFFLDGSNYFSFGLEGAGGGSGGSSGGAPSGKISPFNSRIIGLDDKGTPIPVNYGAKLTGTINNWNIGLLNVSDHRNYGNSNFSVARISRNIGKQSAIGMISSFGSTSDSVSNMLAGLDLTLASSKFKGNKKISLILFGLKSSTENIHGDDGSWGGTFSYPNDLVNFNIGHVEIGKNFNAGIGYVPRLNIKETYGGLTFGPRPNKWGIMQFKFGGNFDYVTDFANKLQSEGLTLNPVGIRFKSGEQFNYSLSQIYDLLEDDFNIYSSFIIPSGEYRWWENDLSLSTDASRNVYGQISYGFGNFYTGRKNSMGITANWKPIVHLFIGATYTSNIVKLPEGEFTANIYQFNLNFLFSPDLTLYNYFQYDSQSKVVGGQSRLRWIIKPGNEILLVWNSGYTKPLDHYIINESSVRFKLKYNFRF